MHLTKYMYLRYYILYVVLQKKDTTYSPNLMQHQARNNTTLLNKLRREKIMTTILKITVDNVAGVLDRIAGVFRHYGWNIDNISAAELKPGITDIKISYKSRFVDEAIIHKKISKMDYVKKYEICTEQTHILLEIAIIKIKEADITPELKEKGKLLFQNEDICFIEYTAFPGDVLNMLSSVNWIDCDRSGGIGLRTTEE